MRETVTLNTYQYDAAGKVNMNDIYNNPDPSGYFAYLSQLDYRIPQEAKPRFQRLIAARRQSTESAAAKLVDLGCSYGINGALLKHGLTMEQLYDRYSDETETDPATLLARDRAMFAGTADPALEMVGVDPAARAVSYAVESGILDAGVVTDLETRDPSARDVAAIETSDMIISTGCVGYVTETSLEKLLEISADSRPWMAHFVLRMFGFDAAQEMLAQHGYVTETVPGLFRQRRFASAEEQQHVLDNLAARSVDPSGAEETGWYLAQLHVARPAEVARALPLAEILPN